MPLQSAYLYYNVTEKVRHMMESYFRLEVPLHFSYSHLVCRTAIAGEHGLAGAQPEEKQVSRSLLSCRGSSPAAGEGWSWTLPWRPPCCSLPCSFPHKGGVGSLSLRPVWEEEQLGWLLQWGRWLHAVLISAPRGIWDWVLGEAVSGGSWRGHETSQRRLVPPE